MMIPFQKSAPYTSMVDPSATHPSAHWVCDTQRRESESWSRGRTRHAKTDPEGHKEEEARCAARFHNTAFVNQTWGRRTQQILTRKVNRHARLNAGTRRTSALARKCVHFFVRDKRPTVSEKKLYLRRSMSDK